MVTTMQRLLLLLLFVVVSWLPARAAESESPARAKTSSVPALPATPPGAPPGVAVAQAVSTVTGVAISPLLGAGAVGAWRYVTTKPAERGNLPWYARPWFWLTSMIIVGLVFLKDALGPATPKVIKKPLDLLELFENKASALVAAGVVIPLLMETLNQHRGGAQASLATAGFAALDFGGAGAWAGGAVALVAFFIVWLAAHAINILILLSPFGTVDAALKVVRMSVLGSVVAAAVINPWLGAVWSLVIIALAALIAGWSLRLTVFGTVLAWDLVTLARQRFEVSAEGVRAFTARALGAAPVRTLGRLVRDADGRRWFAYRRWWILPERREALPDGPLAIGRGLIHDDVVVEGGGGITPVLRLPPRTRSRVAELTAAYGLGEPCDVGLRRGVKALIQWINGRTASPVEPAGLPG